MYRKIAIIIFASAIPTLICCEEITSNSMSDRMLKLENTIKNLQNELDDVPRRVGGAIVFMLLFIGCMCALWAQNTGRNAWAWFFAGLFFHFFTLMILLYKNSQQKSPQVF